MTKAGDTIFPAPVGLNYTSGLTVREYFAALAMQGLLNRGHIQHSHNFGALMDDAVLAADALIEALNKEAE